MNTLKYVEQHMQHTPNILMPEIRGILATEKLTFLSMTSIEGEPQDKTWTGLTMLLKPSIQGQLTAVFHAVRSVPTLAIGKGTVSS